MRNYLLLITLLIYSSTILAQKMPFKFGVLDKEYLEMDIYPLDSGADAVVLADYGKADFVYNKTDGFYFLFERTTRIKIINSDGYDQANIEIGLYHSKRGAKETLPKLKGITYNLENGKISKSKLEKGGRFKEDYDDNWTLEKFTMPDVREGSVIEYQYIIKSPFWSNLRTWEFQKDIPVMYSEFYVTIPEYFDYQQLSSGYHPLYIVDEKQSRGRIDISTVERSGDLTVKSELNNQTIEFHQTQYRRMAKDIPAFKEEAFMNGVNDYVTKIEFELRGTKFPNRPYETRIGTWPSLNKTFLESENFGIAINQNGFLEEPLSSIETLETAEEKIAATVNLIREEMEWNGSYRYSSTYSLKKLWNDKKGSSADLNLTLVAALRRLGIQADPVLISTRNHGLVREHFAISSQFNCVIAVATVGNSQYLLDATNRNLPVGVLPEIYINGKGFVVSKEHSRWVDLEPSSKSETMISAKMNLDESGNLEGTLMTRLKGYQSYESWGKYVQNGKDEYMDDLKESHKSWTIKECNFPEEINLTQPFKQELHVQLNESADIVGDLIFLNPIFSGRVTENPFKLEDRMFPVDFIYPRSYMYMVNLDIPEGYEIDEKPEPIAVSLPNNGGKFHYNVVVNGDLINIVCSYSIDKSTFLPSEYQGLKEFFNVMVNKQEEQLVLKRKI